MQKSISIQIIVFVYSTNDIFLILVKMKRFMKFNVKTSSEIFCVTTVQVKVKSDANLP